MPGLSLIQGWLGGAHSEGGFSLEGRTLFIAFAAEIIAYFMVAPGQSVTNFEFLLFISPLWIPVLLGHFAYMRYFYAGKVEFISKQKTVLLEIKLPRENLKTPMAMEIIFSNINLMSGEATWYKRIIQGRSRPTWSFELVSLGGQVHLYVWCRDVFRRPLESFFYAQYPGIEIIEAMDYSRLVDPTHEPYQMAAFEYLHTNPIDAYPIKTYVEFGLDKVQKPEEQVDPLAQLFETLGSIGPKEQFWIQFVLRATKYEKYEGQKNKAGGQYTWKDQGKEEIEKIRESLITKSEYLDPATGQMITTKGFPNPTEGDKDKIKAIEQNIGKIAFDVGIRTIYAAPAESYHKSMGSIVTNIFKPFNSEKYNGLKPGARWSEHFNDYPWEDPGGHHLAHAMHSVLEFYRRRAFFYPPYVGMWNTMSVEELATIFRVPSSVITTPSLPRIQSTTSEAPVNLPT